MELTEAFDRNIRVIPVTIFPAGLPARELLPNEIQGLAFLQARVNWPDLAFENSVHQLIDELQVILDGDRPNGIDGLRISRERFSDGPSSESFQKKQRTTQRNPQTIAGRFLMFAAIASSSLSIAAGIKLFQPAMKTKAQAEQRPEIAEVVESQFSEPTASQKSQIDRIVAAFRKTTPSPVRERSSRSSEQGTLGVPDFSAFEILSDELTWDIRGFSLRNKDDPPFTSYAILHRRFRFQKIVECSEIRFEARTSATDVFLRSTSHSDLSQEFVSRSPRIV